MVRIDGAYGKLGARECYVSIHYKALEYKQSAQLQLQTFAMAAQLQFNQPLPPNPYNVHAEPEWHSAYASCLQLQPPPGELKKQRMQARSLGYMIIEAPTAEGRNYICHDIVRCGGDSVKLCSLADRYVLHFLRVCGSTLHGMLLLG